MYYKNIFIFVRGNTIYLSYLLYKRLQNTYSETIQFTLVTFQKIWFIKLIYSLKKNKKVYVHYTKWTNHSARSRIFLHYTKHKIDMII